MNLEELRESLDLFPREDVADRGDLEYVSTMVIRATLQSMKEMELRILEAVPCHRGCTHTSEEMFGTEFKCKRCTALERIRDNE